MRTPFIIAIDGYSSCGKSTMAKAAAEKLGFIYVDSGAMYRAATLYFLEKNIDLKDTKAVSNALDAIQIELKPGTGQVILNGKDVTEAIRQMPVSRLVSRVSAIAEVRNKMVNLQREIGQRENLVMDGRDIGTVVFPDASLKIFMTADPAVRARRRFDELRARGQEVSLEEIQKNLLMRDHNDTTRKESPLKQAHDALVLDNSHLTREQQLDWIMEKVKAKRAETNS